MLFSEYAQALSPYISCGVSTDYYFIELIGNFIKDTAMDSCEILKYPPDTKYRYIKGSRIIPSEKALFLYQHRDMEKFKLWLEKKIEDSESYDEIEKWLRENNIITDDYIPDICAELLESIILSLATPDTVEKEHDTKFRTHKLLYISDTAKSDSTTTTIAKTIPEFKAVGVSSYHTLCNDNQTIKLNENNTYRLTTTFTFDWDYSKGTQMVKISFLWNDVMFCGFMSPKNWISTSYMNGCMYSGKKKSTAIFKVINTEKPTIQILMLLEDIYD